jgi:soluble lytic murein transglycosylase-like protein/vacuolar-type H+-ATPase subunit H
MHAGRTLSFAVALVFLAAASHAAPPPAQQQQRGDPDFPDEPEKAGTMEEQIQAAQEGMHQQVDEAQEHQQEEFQKLSERMEAQYTQLQERLDAQRESFHKRVAQQWTDVAESSQKMWVDYAKNTDARSKVDFENGEVEVEVLVPVEQISPGKKVDPAQLDKAQQERLRALAEEKLKEQTQRMLARRSPGPEPKKLDPAPAPKKVEPPPEPKKAEPPPESKKQDPVPTPPEVKKHDPSPPPEKKPEPVRPPPPESKKQDPAPTSPDSKKHAPDPKPPPEPKKAEPPPPSKKDAPVLEGQLRDSQGRAVTEKDADRFAKELSAKATIDPKPVVGADGKARVKVKVKVPMVEGHLKVRAERYSDSVNQAAAKLGLDPALVFSVIHTESAFNPMAQSSAGAYGLMQLLPKQGAHEAYRWLHKKEKAITPEELYDPATNISLGAAYLAILSGTNFSQAKNPETKQVLSIAAYNCGPTKLKKSVVNGHTLATMKPDEAAQLVAAKAPEETKNYLVRVRQRMSLYR